MARPIIVEAEQKVACPKCNHRFPLSEGISRQAIERQAAELERALAEDRKKLEARAAAEAKAQFDVQLKALNEALSAKDGTLAKFRTEELALRRQLRETEEARKNQDLEYQRKLDAERKKIEDTARAAVSEEFSRREAQWKAQIESVQREAADPSARLEQGSQQLQGEALELSLEALLKAAFPLDEILPVPKGVNGADLIQRVRSPSGAVCGTILWEAKQTKAWQPAWLRKLKDEQQEIGAELAVIVTAAMPKDTREPFLRESDVWVARFDAARPLAEALRSLAHRAAQAAPGQPRPQREDGAPLQLHLQPAVRAAPEVRLRRLRHHARGPGSREGRDGAHVEEARSAAHPHAGRAAQRGGRPAGHQPGRAPRARHGRRAARPGSGLESGQACDSRFRALTPNLTEAA